MTGARSFAIALLMAALTGCAAGAERLCVEVAAEVGLDFDNPYGRVLAEDICADRDLPPFNRAQMDGYAVRAAEVGKVESFEVVATIAAGRDAKVDRICFDFLRGIRDICRPFSCALNLLSAQSDRNVNVCVAIHLRHSLLCFVDTVVV